MGLDDDLQPAMSLEPHALRKAALIWARAPALRDRRPEPATVEEECRGSNGV